MIHNLVFGPPQGVPEYDFERYHRRMLDAIKKIGPSRFSVGHTRYSGVEQ